VATKEQAIIQGYRLLNNPPLALRQASEVIRQYPNDSGGYRLLGAAKRQIGDIKGAIEAERRSIDASKIDGELIEAANAMRDMKLKDAEILLKGRLQRDPFDVVAIRLLATLAAHVGQHENAIEFLRRALHIMPSYGEARNDLAHQLSKHGKAEDALVLLDEMEEAGELTPSRRASRASVLSRIGQYQKAIADYETALEANPDNPGLWASVGHAYKTVGDNDRAIDAYRAAARIRPGAGDAWWSLANLKTFRFTDDELAGMEAALSDEGLSPDDRLQIHFALGKGYEDRKLAEPAWRNYAAGNRVRLKQVPHSATAETKLVDRTIKLMDREFFERRRGQGCPAPDPIFVVGMPRAGSTLLEQILSSHSAIEGTMELGEVIAFARSLGDRTRNSDDGYPGNIANLSADQLRGFGERFIESTRIHRIEGLPFFIDKMPNNWQHAGFIKLILPNAKIIDARRHPLDCGFSNFKQHFARGQTFTYNLADFGRYYRDYVRLMDHFDKVQPGMVYRFVHEQLLDDPEPAVRGVLDFLGLPFEESCLRFYDNKRAVRTPSAEQVRQPLSKKAVGSYRLFEQWLDPLKQALGPALDHWDDPQPWRAGKPT
jgi:tetratricopeptide (TPR) repeat protein